MKLKFTPRAYAPRLSELLSINQVTPKPIGWFGDIIELTPGPIGWAGVRNCGGGDNMSVTIKYMLRPVAHCKEGCSKSSWARL